MGDNDSFYQQLMDFDAGDDDGGGVLGAEVELSVEASKEREAELHARARIVLDGDALEKMKPCEVFVVDYREHWAKATPSYYRCIVPEEAHEIVKCAGCQFLFNGEEFEVALINNAHLCPFCRTKCA